MRRHFDPDAIAGLAQSIRESGVIQPVVVRPVADGYELLAGERRWRAAQLAGQHEIPAVVREDISDDEALVLGLVENLQRESLSPMETAQGLKVLSEQLSLTHGEAAERIGKSRVYVTNFLRLLNLAPGVREQVNAGQLSMGHARALAALPPAQQELWAAQCVAGQWSVRRLEARVRSDVPPAKVPAAASGGGDGQRLARLLEEHLGNKVQVQTDAQGKGALTVHFHSYDELDGLLQRLGVTLDL